MGPAMILLAALGLPPGAVEYGPWLVAAQQGSWPDAPQPWTLGGQVEQESSYNFV